MNENKKLIIHNPEKTRLVDHFGKIYYYFSMLIALFFKPLNYWSYYRENFLPLFKLINRSFTKSIVYTFMSIWYPFIFIVILTQTFPAQTIIFAIGILIPTTIGMLVLPSLLVEFKQSSLLKKIGATKIDTWMLSLTFILYFVMVSLFSTLFNLGIGIAMNWSSITFGQMTLPGGIVITQIVNWVQYIIALLLATIMGLSVGMCIAAVVKTPAQATLMGLLITVPGGFLSGQFLSFAIINSVSWLKWAGFIFPQKWATLLAVIATSGGNIFNFNSGAIILDFVNIGNVVKILQFLPLPGELVKHYPMQFAAATKGVLIAGYIAIPLIITCAITISIKKFKWQSR